MRGRFVRRVWQHDPAVYAPARYRHACGYEAFIPDPVAGFDVDITGTLAGVVSDAENAIRSLNAIAQPGLQPLARLLLRTESIASSKVEGLQLDARSVARAEVRAETGHPIGATAAEIIGNINAMQLAVEEASATDAITPDHLIDIHRVLMANAHNAQVAGQLRQEQNWIGGNDYNPCGAEFVPPPHEAVRDLLADLCELCRSDHLPPLVQAAVVHAQFETIHPFMDGNGRTGRALIYVVLRRRGLAPAYVPPVSVILAQHKARYIGGLTAFREGRVAGWLEHFAAAAATAATLAEGYLARVRAMQQQWRTRLAATVAPRADAAAWLIIEQLPAFPVITVPVAVAATGRTKPAVNAALGQLEEAGIVVRLGQSQRNRAWEAAGLLDLLADLDAGR